MITSGLFRDVDQDFESEIGLNLEVIERPVKVFQVSLDAG
jgi:hypothetical protein